MKSLFMLMFLLIRTAEVLSKDLSASERANRAAFIQRLLNKDKYLEGRVKLVGGPNPYEGKRKLSITISNLIYYLKS